VNNYNFIFGEGRVSHLNTSADRSEMKYKISLFIPIFNEEKIIRSSVGTIDNMLSRIAAEYEIFIVNDASRDNTKTICSKIEENNTRVRLLNYTIGPTRRENLAQSFKKATGDIIVFVDVDSIASLNSLQDLIGQIISGYDVATGSRFVKGSKIRRKPTRLLMSVVYNALIRLIFRTKINDHMCGFKAFKRDVILKLVEEMGYDNSLRRGIFWDTELLIRALDNGYTVKEIPIRWVERLESRLYFRREIRAIGYIINFAKKFKNQNDIRN
jgi:glycosyltransferase involved in cell wall biosynthesis